MRHGILTILLLAALGGCAPQASDFKMTGTPSNRDRDFAECRIKATEVSGRSGGVAELKAFNHTLNDCMTAKGYMKSFIPSG